MDPRTEPSHPGEVKPILPDGCCFGKGGEKGEVGVLVLFKMVSI